MTRWLRPAALALLTLTLAGCASHAPPDGQLVVPPACDPAQAALGGSVENADGPSNTGTDRPVRAAHLRVWNASGALLYSTWPCEESAYAHEDPVNLSGHPIPWKTSRNVTREVPMWAPLLRMLDEAPPNATIRLMNYSMGDHKVGKLNLPVYFDLPREGSLPHESAERIFGNITPGAARLYLGEIPVRVVNADESTVQYELDVESALVVPVQRSTGLFLRIEPSPLPGLVRFSPSAPLGGFTAHNNCAVQEKIIPPGYYALRGESNGSLQLDRYNTRGEYLMEGQTANIEIRFFDDPSEAPRLPDATKEH